MAATDAPEAFTTATSCRISGSPMLADVLSLGNQPLANSLKEAPSSPELKVPLTVSYCSESSLLQIRETIRKEILFSQYVWVSGTAQATRDWAVRFAGAVAEIASLGADDLVLEIASNDGTFLEPLLARGCRRVLGIDPAANIAEIARANGIPTLTAFWDEDTARRVVEERGRAKLIFARNVIAHVSDLESVMRGIVLALSDDGVGVFEFHAAGEILDGLQYDSIYHEHLCYFSLASMQYLLKRFDLHLFHAHVSPISGGALVVYFAKTPRAPTTELRAMSRDEDRRGVNRLDTWQRFADRAVNHRRESVALATSLAPSRMVGYGSSARSSTYLNFCAFGTREITAVIDNNQLKQGKFTPGSSLPIVSMAEGLAVSPDYVFIFAWNFREEIMKSCRAAGYAGRFVTAFPTAPRVWR